MCAQSKNTIKKNNDDQRYFPRWIVTAPVLYKHQTIPQPQNGQTKDLSCSGACVAIREPLCLNEKVKLTIYLSPSEGVEVLGRVIWQHTSLHENLTGISFYDTSDAVQDRILQHAFKVDREKITKHWFSGWENR